MILTQSRNDIPTAIATFATLAALLMPFILYFDTAQSIVAMWNSSDTFAHGYAILPVSLWLVWHKRDRLARLSPRPFWPALAVLAACGFGWLMGRLADAQVVMQYAFVAMLPLTVVAVFGLRVAMAIGFPLAFLMLAVPFGEVFIDPLIGVTADFTVAALQLTGIPVFRNGPNFEIPTGSWSVVEACSGVRYLIASVTLGALYAYLTYRSLSRRVVFIVLSAVVPILANCLRAYLIVMIGHLSDMTLATGVDHLVYGWLFFGLIMFLMFWIGGLWREDDVPETGPTAADSATPGATADPLRLLAGALSAIATISIWPTYAAYLDRAQINPVPPELSQFRPDWAPTGTVADWKPQYFPASAELRQTYVHQSKTVGVSIHYYRNQQPGALLISSSNQLVSEKDPVWRRAGTTLRSESLAGKTLEVKETRLQSSSGPLLVWHWNWIDGRFIANDYVGKLLQAKEKLLMRGDDGAAIMVFARYGDRPDEARDALREFISANLPELERTLRTNRQQGASRS